jgi:uncharacterized membrane-anchored protein YhcB (DUF1043 family)
MDGSRLKRMQIKLDVQDWKNISQKQFNDLVSNLAALDKETIKYIFNKIPDVASKIGQYFKDVQDSMSTKHTEYLTALKEQSELLAKLLEKEQDPRNREKIIDALIEHSKWMQREASILRRFKVVFAVIGAGCAFLFARLLLVVPSCVRLPKTNHHEKNINL